jgi:hypothetical protein
MSLNVLVGGTWLSTLGAWADLTWSTLADGGCGQASWNMQLPHSYSHPSLRRGQLVEIKTGSQNVFKGVLSEPDDSDDGWQLHADGLSADGGGYLCLTASGVTTSTPNTAIDQAITRGMRWTRPTSISSSPFATGDTTDALNYVSDLLDAYAQSISQRWGVDELGRVFVRADPTVPTWHMTPGSGVFGLADDEYASDIYLRFYSTTYALSTVHVGNSLAATQYGRREFAVDGRNLGGVSTATATATAQGLLDKGKARLGWTNPVKPSRWQLTTPGGTPAYLPIVKAGQMVRLHGVRNEQGLILPYVDFVIGETTYSVDSDEITLSPVGMAARSLSDVLAVAS